MVPMGISYSSRHPSAPPTLLPTIPNAVVPPHINSVPSIPSGVRNGWTAFPPARPLPLLDSRFPFALNPLPYPNERPAPTIALSVNDNFYGLASSRVDYGDPQLGHIPSEARVRRRYGHGETYGAGQSQSSHVDDGYGEYGRVIPPVSGQDQDYHLHGIPPLPLTEVQRARITRQNQPDALSPVPAPAPVPLTVPSSPPALTGRPISISPPSLPTHADEGPVLPCLRRGESCDDPSDRYARTCHAQRKYYHPQYVVDKWVHASPAIGRVHAGHKIKPESGRDDEVGDKEDEEKRNECGNELRIFKIFALILSLIGGVLLIAHHTRQIHDIATQPMESSQTSYRDPYPSSSPSSTGSGFLHPRRTNKTNLKSKQTENIIHSKREGESESGMVLELLSDIAVTLGGLILLLISLSGLWRQYYSSFSSPDKSTTYICSTCLKPWSDINGCRWEWGCCVVRTESNDMRDTGCNPVYHCSSCLKGVEEKGCQSRCLTCGTRWIGNAIRKEGRRECLSAERHVY